jgi:hypothetical protein
MQGVQQEAADGLVRGAIKRHDVLQGALHAAHQDVWRRE